MMAVFEDEIHVMENLVVAAVRGEGGDGVEVSGQVKEENEKGDLLQISRRNVVGHAVGSPHHNARTERRKLIDTVS